MGEREDVQFGIGGWLLLLLLVLSRSLLRGCALSHSLPLSLLADAAQRRNLGRRRVDGGASSEAAAARFPLSTSKEGLKPKKKAAAAANAAAAEAAFAP